MRLIPVVLALVLSFIVRHQQQQVQARQPPILRFSTPALALALLASNVANSGQNLVHAQPVFQFIGNGDCKSCGGQHYDSIEFRHNTNYAIVESKIDCERLCVPCASEVSTKDPNRVFHGFTFELDQNPNPKSRCACHFDDDNSSTDFTDECDSGKEGIFKYESKNDGKGAICRSDEHPNRECWAMTEFPSAAPSESPSLDPTSMPSESPSTSTKPSASPSSMPSNSNHPSSSPSESPFTSDKPSESPSSMPSTSIRPSFSPSESPTKSAKPSESPSSMPSSSIQPSFSPSESPSTSTKPSQSPSSMPSTSTHPSFSPSESPSTSDKPTPTTSREVETAKSFLPSSIPSSMPSSSIQPSSRRSASPSISVEPSTSSMPSSTSTSAKGGKSKSKSSKVSDSPSFTPSASRRPSTSVRPSVSVVSPTTLYDMCESICLSDAFLKKPSVSPSVSGRPSTTNMPSSTEGGGKSGKSSFPPASSELQGLSFSSVSEAEDEENDTAIAPSLFQRKN